MKNSLPLCIHPDIEKYKVPVREIKSFINKILEAAVKMSALLRKYDAKTMPVKELQYMDIFSQKLHHVVDLNEALLSTEQSAEEACHTCSTSCNHTHFVFRLNDLQVKAAAYDFTSAMADLAGEELLKNIQHIQELMESLSARLEAMACQRGAASPHGPCAGRVSTAISQIYTMESERYILQWLIDHPKDEAKDVIASYQQQGFGNKKQTIELF